MLEIYSSLSWIPEKEHTLCEFSLKLFYLIL